MATYEQLMGAARQADAAGDEYAARRFLTLARDAQGGAAPAPVVPAVPGPQAMPSTPVQAPAPPQTDMLGQVGTGTNEGIAGMLGMPVDAMTGALNWAGGKMGMPRIESPVGGSESIRGALSPFMTAGEPQTAGERIARRVGQEVGSGAVAAPVAGIASVGNLGLNTLANAASGAAGGATAEMGASPTVQTIASILAGAGTVGAASKIGGARAKGPTLGSLKAERDAAYAKVREAEGTITPEAMSKLNLNIQRATSKAEIDEILHPKASRAVSRLQETEGPTLGKLEQRRQYVGSDVAGSVDSGERRMGSTIKREIDDFLAQMEPGDLSGQANPEEIVDALHKGRAAHAKVAKSEMLTQAINKAERRAATSGVGGNVVNTTRQNIRAILDDPRKARKFNAAEQQMMEAIVRGTKTTNLGRMVGGISPDKGGLSLMGNIAMAGASGASQNPLLLVPGVVGFIAKRVGEDLTDRQVKALEAMVRSGAPVSQKTLTEGQKRVLEAVLAVQGVSAAEPAD